EECCLGCHWCVLRQLVSGARCVSEGTVQHTFRHDRRVLELPARAAAGSPGRRAVAHSCGHYVGEATAVRHKIICDLRRQYGTELAIEFALHGWQALTLHLCHG